MALARRVGALLAIVAVASMLLSPLTARPVFAHASLIKSNPANNETLRRPPARIVLNFSEPIERKLTTIQVADKDGKRYDDGQVEFDDTDKTFASVGVKTLAPGLYFVKWANVSTVDSHNLEGTYPFIVLNPDGTFPAGVSLDSASATTSGGNLLPGNLDAGLKWIALLSLAIAAGAAFMLLAGIRPAAAFLEDEPYHEFTDAAERWVVNISHLLLPASFIAAGFLILLAVNRFQTSMGLVEYLTTLRVGQYRLAGLVAVVVALAGADLLFLGGSERKRNIGLAVMLLASLAALLTYSLVSHSATDKGKVWSVSSDFVHFAASAAWLGALVMLVPVMIWVRRNVRDEAQRFLLLANVFDRFSIIAGLSVITILATGTFNGLTEMPNAHAMLHTTYGKVLLTKLILLMPLLAVAGLNAFVLKPWLVSAIDDAYQAGGAATGERREKAKRRITSLQRWLPRAIVVETALIVAIFAVVGVLSQSATAKGEVAQNAAKTAQAAKFNQAATTGDGLKITLDVSPNQVGINQFSLTVQKSDGTPLTTVTQARLRFTYDEIPGAVAPSEVILTRFADGEFRSAGAYFTQPGNWRVDVGLRRSDGDDVAQPFVLPVARASAASGSKNPGIYDLPFSVFSWNEVAGALVALCGFAMIVYRRQLRWLEQPGYRIMMAAASLLLLSGAVLAFGVTTHRADGNQRAGNPVPPTQASLARGKELFQTNCIVCHGIDGRGDGPTAAQLSPQPTDFRLHMPLHTDPQFYNFIANGYPASAMPTYHGALSDTDIWNLVNYLRSAFTESPSQ